jgi:hypothetical protein
MCGIYIGFLVDLRYFFPILFRTFIIIFFQNCLRCLSSIINRVIRVYLGFLVFNHDVLNKLVFCIMQHFSLCLNKQLNLSKYNWLYDVLLYTSCSWSSILRVGFLIPIVLVSWYMFSLCHTFTRLVSAFRDSLSILL